MTVRLRLKGDASQEVVFPDNAQVRFTAQGFPDGHLEVTRTQPGTFQPGVVVASFVKEQLERVVDNGWSSDNGPL